MTTTSFRLSEDENQIIQSILDEHPYLPQTKSAAVRYALFHTKRRMSMNKIIYTVSTDPEYFGENVSEADAEKLAPIIANKIEEFVTLNYPLINFETSLVSGNEQTKIYGDDPDFVCVEGPDIVAWIEDYHNKHWIDWVKDYCDTL